MDRAYKIIKQLPTPGTIGIGVLSVDRGGTALAIAGDGDGEILARLDRVKMDWVAKNGIMLSGMEPDGCGVHGALKYKYQQWWLVYTSQQQSHE